MDDAVSAFGVIVNVDGYALDALVAHIRRIEALGYESVWITDMFGRDVYVTAGYLLAKQGVPVIVGASSGRGGTRRAQQQVRDALLFPGAVVLEEPQVTLPIAWERFDPDLELTDENAGAALTELVAGLLELAREKHPAAA
jgi:alkanesulfonate monooxygenase SsuD/methylene tetrahydromethanopterin reductase-like flavin-dependent oxidoreductase (luciferase family)